MNFEEIFKEYPSGIGGIDLIKICARKHKNIQLSEIRREIHMALDKHILVLGEGMRVYYKGDDIMGEKYDDVKTVTRYIYKDVEYDSLADVDAAKAKEDITRANLVKLYAKHSGKTGYWKIYNEDRYLLEIVHGHIDNVIEYVITLKKFWGYGPGYIDETNIKEL